jgi:hypothetical protein
LADVDAGLADGVVGLVSAPALQQAAHLAFEGGAGEDGLVGDRVADHRAVDAADGHLAPGPADVQAGDRMDLGVQEQTPSQPEFLRHLRLLFGAGFRGVCPDFAGLVAL